MTAIAQAILGYFSDNDAAGLIRSCEIEMLI
jgi:hypothetical protein